MKNWNSILKVNEVQDLVIRIVYGRQEVVSIHQLGYRTVLFVW